MKALSRVRLFLNHEWEPARLLSPWDSPGKNTGVGCHFLLHGIFPIQGSNPGFQHCRQILYRLSGNGAQGEEAEWWAWVPPRQSPGQELCTGRGLGEAPQEQKGVALKSSSRKQGGPAQGALSSGSAKRPWGMVLLAATKEPCREGFRLICLQEGSQIFIPQLRPLLAEGHPEG